MRGPCVVRAAANQISERDRVSEAVVVGGSESWARSALRPPRPASSQQRRCHRQASSPSQPPSSTASSQGRRPFQASSSRRRARSWRSVPVGLTPDWHKKKGGELFMQEPLFWPCACEDG